jgi:hypothetical protein
MTVFYYLMTVSKDFPEPGGEIASLVGLSEESDPCYLQLAGGANKTPPGGDAHVGDFFYLCTRASDGQTLIPHARGVVQGRPTRHEEAPESVRGLYKGIRNRYFVRFRELVALPPEAPVELTQEELETFAQGQAWVKRVDEEIRGIQEASLEALIAPNLVPRERPGIGVIVIGLDPTAGTWSSGMTEGVKSMPSVSLEVLPDGTIRMPSLAVQTHRNNQEFYDRVKALNAAVACIDGPCATRGPDVLKDWSGWNPKSPDGARSGEVELFRKGVGLFWTCKATVTNFNGAREWIARSLRIFRDAREQLPSTTLIETHPHGAFTFLWRVCGGPGSLPGPKDTSEGMAARCALLGKFIHDLDEEALREYGGRGSCQLHDRIDAAGAALVAAFHRVGRTVAFGKPGDGGEIWMPRLEAVP